MSEGKIIRVSGPLVVAENMKGSRMYDVVHVGEEKLVGEIIELEKDLASIQVYEETEGIGVGQPVFLTGEPLSVSLGPGLIESIYDGIQRPLDKIKDKTGNFISRGISMPAIDPQKKWDFNPVKKEGDKVVGGDIIGTVQETVLIEHKVMVPLGVEGTIEKINKSKFTVKDVVAVIKTKEGNKEITMEQRWGVRNGRPVKKRLAPVMPLFTGQRVIDTFFPVAKGGTASVPGPFGSGKTVIQHQLAKWAEAEVVVYIGCGERGNEMTDVLNEFPKLLDPKSGEPLMKRTVLLANTSNMPVAAREASIYTGITIAEYFRDMGYSVALMADSTSRWAEALREISGRLEEMPGEEGYPAYLGSKIAEFYERAGRVKCLGSDDREGAISVIGAVSPPGGDLSDPVVQNTLRVVKVFWSLKAELAYARHFPAIDWLTSYSLYPDNVKDYINKEVAEDFLEIEQEAMKLLEEEDELQEMVRLVGIDALSARERRILIAARIIREDFLHQNAFHEVDTYTSIKKQYLMLKAIITFYWASEKNDAEPEKLEELDILEEIARMKFVEEEEIKKIEELQNKIKDAVGKIATVKEEVGA
ncbi:V-type ATP synthase subunit A [candidate division WOR-3 bacterium]|nr:V-type ATP synthase subunit A [candidate division WOR-3 bacterium]